MHFKLTVQIIFDESSNCSLNLTNFVCFFKDYFYRMIQLQHKKSKTVRVGLYDFIDFRANNEIYKK